MVDVPGKGGSNLFADTARDAADKKVRFVGDPVALVVAESRAEAQDAAELMMMDYDILPSVTDTAAALDPDAPILWEENGSNLCVPWDSGREAEAEAASPRPRRRYRSSW